jgi:hypothetical protein
LSAQNAAQDAPLPTAPPGPAAPGVFYYTSNKTNSNYTLNTSPASYADANLWCQDNGGNLASYGSLAEHREVEQHFVKAGFLFPTFHKHYWLGVQVRAPGQARRLLHQCGSSFAGRKRRGVAGAPACCG